MKSEVQLYFENRVTISRITFEFLVASWIHLTYIFLIGIDIAVVLSVREVQSVESDPEILSRLSQCLVVYTPTPEENSL